jgi:hypothetical protein
MNKKLKSFISNPTVKLLTGCSFLILGLYLLYKYLPEVTGVFTRYNTWDGITIFILSFLGFVLAVAGGLLILFKVKENN